MCIRGGGDGGAEALQGDAKSESLLQKILNYPHPLRAGKEFQHEVTSVRNSGAGLKRFFALQNDNNYNEITTQTTFARNDMKRHCERSEAIQNNPSPAFVARYARTTASSPARGEDIVAPQEVTNSLTYSPINLLTRKRIAFTLAEILITLAIVGIVAVLIMQTLIIPYQKKVTAIQLKKAYSLLVNASTRALADEDFNFIPPDKYEVKLDNNDEYGIFAAYFAPYLNAKEIKTKKSDWVAITPAGNSTIGVGRFYEGCYQTNNGMCFRMINHGTNYFYILVDLNSKSGPNIVGRDIFYFGFHFTNYGVKVDGTGNPLNVNMSMEQLIKRCGKEYNNWDGGSTCTEIIMRNDWKIPDYYPW